MRDTSGTVEIKASPFKMALYVLLGLVMTSSGGLLLYIADGTLAFLAGAIGLVFFGGVTCLLAWKLVFETGTVITLSPQGICDVRIAPEIIPWPAIMSINTWSHMGQEYVMLVVDPEVLQTLDLSKLARLAGPANRLVGADGLAVPVQGTQVSFNEFRDACLGYFGKYGGLN